MGDRENAIKLAKHNIAAFENCQFVYIVSACPTCTYALAHEFLYLLKDEREWVERAKKFAEKVKDFSQLVHKLGVAEMKAGEQFKITYHDSCHLKRSLGMYEEPRELLKSLEGT